MLAIGIFIERFLIVSSSGFTFTRVKDQMIQEFARLLWTELRTVEEDLRDISWIQAEHVLS